MSEPAWDTVKRVVADALERPAAERAAFLEEACGDDDALRAEVESLLPDPDTEERFLAAPAFASFEVPALGPGTMLGRFQLGRVLGEGGMGRVYEATQERPHRTVALKVLRPGFLANEAERRFEWEVEALARLDHPAIAKVFDAGTSQLDERTSVPWFAMEKIDGRPLLEAAEALGLDRRARLTLFAQVCDGIAHAHRRGVIHRDLKPDNVLVGDDRQPHILDFGIARIADPLASSMTSAGQVLGTLAFIAPEQLAADPAMVDVRTDVYALGGMLYRLLTGHAPLDFDRMSFAQIAARLASEDPAPASRFDRTLAGDLDTILATALAREPERRYATAEELAGDVRRFLDHQPIRARPATALYQLGKLARRHRGLAASLALSLVLLVVATVGTSIGMLRAERARELADAERHRTELALERAEIERDRFRSTNDLLTSMLGSADPELDGEDVRVVDLLDAASADLAADEALEPAIRASLHLTLGKTYQRLGLLDPSERQLLAAIELFDATDGAVSELAIEARAARCELLYARGDLERGRAVEDRVRADAAAMIDPPAWVEARPLELAALRHEVAGENDETLAAYRDLVGFWAQHRDADADSYETSLNNLGVALLDRGELRNAERLLREALGLRTARLGADHPSVLTHRANLASSLADLGHLPEAASVFEEVVPAIRAAFGESHATTLSVRNNQASTLGALGDKEGAHAIYVELLEATQARFGLDHRQTWTVRNNLGVSAIEVGRFDDAERVLRALLVSIERSGGRVEPAFVTRAELNLVSALDRAGRPAEAEPLSARGLAQLIELLGPAAMPTLAARNNHALLLARLGRADEAVPLALENVDLARAHYPGHPMIVFPFESNLGRVLSAAGRHAEALERLRGVERALDAAGDDRAADLTRCRELLVDATRAATGG